jgi:hypothetical protein
MRNKGRQSRTVLSVVGRVKVVRRWWHAAGSGSVVPADAVIDPGLSNVSVGVREMACRLNNDGTSFEKTANNLYRTALVRMGAEQLRLLVQAEGRAVLAAQRNDTVATAFQAVDCVVDASLPKAERTSRVYSGVDGVMVPIITETEKAKRRETVLRKRRTRGTKHRPLAPRKRGANESFKEFKTIVFYDESGARWHERLSRCTRTRVGALVRREAKRPGFARAHEKIAIVDGATWIPPQLTARPSEMRLDGLGLDFYHLAENVHRCRRKVFGEEDEAGKTWAGDLLHTLKHDGYESAWEILTRWRAALRGPSKKHAADRLLNYVGDRRDMIRYPEFAKKQWQIGSGPTESRCKTSTSRLKGRGRRWDADNAEATAALTTLQDSHQWNLYWNIPALAKT